MAGMSALERGALVGRYVVLDRLGEGGMGGVYAAYDPELDRRVALKLVRGGAEDAGLLREAQTAARLIHPNVITVHDVGTHEGAVFIAMEHVEGQTLRQWMAIGPRPYPEVVALLARAGEGLAAAHRAGIVHRDFKPENVLLGADGRVRVTDFGLAIPAAAAAATSDTWSGTPAYLAPERYLGEATDARADQFAFSVVLFEALHGVHPFGERVVAGTPSVIAEQVLDGNVVEPPPGARVPGWVRAAVARRLSRDPADRWPAKDRT